MAVRIVVPVVAEAGAAAHLQTGLRGSSPLFHVKCERNHHSFVLRRTWREDLGREPLSTEDTAKEVLDIVCKQSRDKLAPSKHLEASGDSWSAPFVTGCVGAVSDASFSGCLNLCR